MYCYIQFVRLVEKRKTHKVWKNIDMIQRVICNKDNIYNMQRVKFNIETLDEELLRRAALETRLLMGNVPVISDEFISPQSEIEFQRNLMQKDPKKYCKYLLAKIYHWIRIMHKTVIRRMYGTFFSDGKDYYFTNCKVIEYRIKDLEVETRLRKNKKMSDGVMSEVQRVEKLENERREMAAKLELLEKKNNERKMLRQVAMMQNEHSTFHQFNYLLQDSLKKDKQFLMQRRPVNYTRYRKTNASIRNDDGVYRNISPGSPVVKPPKKKKTRRLKHKRKSVLLSLKGSSVNQLMRSRKMIFGDKELEARPNEAKIKAKARSASIRKRNKFEEKANKTSNHFKRFFRTENGKMSRVKINMKKREEELRKDEIAEKKNRTLEYGKRFIEESSFMMDRVSSNLFNSMRRDRMKDVKRRGVNAISRSLNLGNKSLELIKEKQSEFINKFNKIFEDEKKRKNRPFNFFTKGTNRRISKAERQYQKMISRMNITNPMHSRKKKNFMDPKTRARSSTMDRKVYDYPKLQMRMVPGEFQQNSMNTLKNLLLVNYSCIRDEED